jgi:hypothetical protein
MLRAMVCKTSRWGLWGAFLFALRCATLSSSCRAILLLARQHHHVMILKQNWKKPSAWMDSSGRP